MTQITIDIPDELISRLHSLRVPLSDIIAIALENYLTNESNYIPQSDLEDYQNFVSAPITPVTETEQEIANAIIKQAWQDATSSQPSSKEEIWSEFDEIRRQIKSSYQILNKKSS